MTLNKETLSYLDKQGFDVENNIHYVESEHEQHELHETLKRIITESNTEGTQSTPPSGESLDRQSQD